MYYTILLEPYMGMSEGKGNYLAARISIVQPVTENFDLPEGKRPAYKVGLPFHPFRKPGVPAPVGEVHWLRIKPPSTGAVQRQLELEVFIQSHALRRMYAGSRPDGHPVAASRFLLFICHVEAHH